MFIQREISSVFLGSEPIITRWRSEVVSQTAIVSQQDGGLLALHHLACASVRVGFAPLRSPPHLVIANE